MSQSYKTFPDNSKVWVFQSSRFFTESELNLLRVKLTAFVDNWDSHGSLLKADYDILHKLFIVFFVDEQGDRMCGSAQDRLLRLMKEIESELEVELLNRMNLSYMDGNVPRVVRMSDFSALATTGDIQEETLVFDNSISTKSAFDHKWMVSIKDSWHKQLLN